MSDSVITAPTVGEQVTAAAIEETLSWASEHGFGERLSSAFDLGLPIGEPPPTPTVEAINGLLETSAEAPAATTVVAVPKEPVGGDAALLEDIQMVDSLISVLTAWVVYSKHPQPYDLHDPQQAAQFVIDWANAANFVVTGGSIKQIPMYLTMEEATAQTLNKSMTNLEVHIEFLATLFGSFGLTPETLTELDGILTEIAKTLGNLKLSFHEENQTLNHFLSFHRLVPVVGSEPVIHEMKTAFVFLTIAQSSWKAAIGKSSVDRFSFDMGYVTTKGALNPGIVRANASTIAAALQKLTAHDPAKIAEMTKAQSVKS